jgi:LysR family glycine cleavage system transcriptional activator
MSKFHLPVLNSLRAFEAAARHQSIKKACDELHVNHAAVSRQILNLEGRLGRDLFERHHRKVVLNDAGEILFNAVTLGFTHIQRAVAQLSGSRTPARLLISVDPDFAGLWLVPRLAEFYAAVPNELVEIRSERNLDALSDSRIDCAIQYAEAGSVIEDGEVLFRSTLFPVCAQIMTQEPPLRSPEDLLRHTLLHDRSLLEWEEFLQRCSVGIDVNLRSGVIFSETVLCLDAASRGQGVAIGDDFLAAIHLAEGRLVRPFDSGFLSKNAYYFLMAERAVKHPAVDIFRAWLFQTVDRLRNELGVRH